MISEEFVGVRGIIPDYLLRRLAESGDPAAERTLLSGSTYRLERGLASLAAHTPAEPTVATAAAAPQRVIADARNRETLPGTVVRREGEPATGDLAADEAYDGFGATWTLFAEEFGRNSIDGAGMELAGTVHYGRSYDNAFWNGERMVFGDGDGEIFGRFTASLDVIGHELTHGITERTAGLVYAGQSGALNEHLSDVFGSLVKQRQLSQTASEADWLIGEDLLLPGVSGVALRNLLHPGTAYDDPRLGRDPQPDHMDRYVVTRDDHGGVHINSGIPNRAFALAALEVGGEAWAGVGQVWYDTLTGAGITPSTDFAGFAALTLEASRARFGPDGPVERAIAEGWRAVGVVPRTAGDAAPDPAPPVDTEAELLLRRTGGVAGLVKERRATLEELPPKDARRWVLLLTSDALTTLASSDGRVDGFCYQVACHSVDLDIDVTVAEERLSDTQRALFARTLNPRARG